ncbi:MAG: alanine racemase [Cyanobacteria bacterium J06648_11]
MTLDRDSSLATRNVSADDGTSPGSTEGDRSGASTSLRLQPDLATQRAWVEVDLAAIRHNVRVLRERLQPNCEFWAVVKANAYGHGAIPVSRVAIAAGARGLCVATLAEGLELRAAGIDAPILLLGPLYSAREIEIAAARRLELTLVTDASIAECDRIGQQLGHPISVHLNVDTGMSRLGIPAHRALACWRAIAAASYLDGRSLYSHFATADELDHPATQQQSDRFARIIREFQTQSIALPTLHLSNSAATLSNARWHHQLVRVGLAMYGYAPASHLNAEGRLRPAMSVKARITQLKTVPAGTGISYGHRYTTRQPTRLATVAIGYADGVPRCLSGRLRSHIGRVPTQQVGTITMDQTLWDVSQVPADDIAIGQPLTILSPTHSAQTWADLAGTISYEILCGFSARLPRAYVESTRDRDFTGDRANDPNPN